MVATASAQTDSLHLPLVRSLRIARDLSEPGSPVREALEAALKCVRLSEFQLQVNDQQAAVAALRQSVAHLHKTSRARPDEREGRALEETRRQMTIALFELQCR
jgi:hypothetical protein